ncbi:ABC transporter ATP-binding protein [Shewanella algae]|uniref:ABC transporter ATP-binding protein n=1 Tax=Shewanella algae TaxID=38313 RepID=UPI001AAC4B66|nr:ABC transporter ATP-binding protein [Shewanella algae]MBO2560637.1 ABC transporter ATP-binding protein [Shewanella algae]
MTQYPDYDIALSGHELYLEYGQRPIISAMNLAIPKGKLTVILGPNGCGKSTLLKCLSQVLPPTRGQVILGHTPLAQLSNKARARELALLVQKPELPEGIDVQELVSRGRYPHQSLWHQWSEQDELAVAQALAATGLTALAQRPVAELSGGQQQRVWLAMVLAQQTDLLLLDEPTSFLDIRAQLAVLDFCRVLVDQGRTLVLVLHDINQALRYGDHLLLMRDGKLIAGGAPESLLTEALLEQVFDINASIITDPEANCPMIIPRPRAKPRAAGHQGGEDSTNTATGGLPSWE